MNLAAVAEVKTSAQRGRSDEYSGSNLIDGNTESYWATNDDVIKADIEIVLPKPEQVSYILIQEYIPLGQRIKAFVVEAESDGKWIQIASGTTIGYKRILRTEPVETQKIRIRINDSKACPLLSNVEIY